MNETKESAPEPEDIPEIQINIAKKHYGNLYRESIAKVVLYSIPAVIFTIASIFLYVSAEEGFFINGINYTSPSYLNILVIAAAVVSWGLFFWLKVNSNRKQAELWRKSMESYEQLVRTESQLKTDAQKKEASRRSLRKGQREILRQERMGKVKPILK